MYGALQVEKLACLACVREEKAEECVHLDAVNLFDVLRMRPRWIDSLEDEGEDW